jgi:hypothetical protein
LIQDLKVSPGPGSPAFVTRTFDPATSTEKLYTADANGNTLTGNGRTFVWTADSRVDSVINGAAP